MPNRILYESICASETLDALSVSAERFFYRLLVQADDFGRMDARPQVLRSKCFQLSSDEISIDDIRSWLNEMAAVGLIQLYEVDGRPYLQFVTWEKRQRRRATKSKYPPPPDGCMSADCQPHAGARNMSADDGQPHANDGHMTDNGGHSHADDSQPSDIGAQPHANDGHVTVICGQMPANDGHMTDNGGHPLSSAPVFEYEYEYENEKRECAHAREGSGDDSHSSPSPIVKIWEQEARSVLNPAQFAKLERAFIGENALDPTALPEAIKLCKERIGRITPEYTTGILMNWREERMRMQTERKRTRDEPPAASSARDPTPDEVSSSPANDPVYLSWLEQYYAALREERKKREKEAG